MGFSVAKKSFKFTLQFNVNTKIQISDLATKWEDEYRGKSTDFQFFSTSLYYKIHEIVKKILIVNKNPCQLYACVAENNESRKLKPLCESDLSNFGQKLKAF